MLLFLTFLTRCYIRLTHQTLLTPWVDYWTSSCLYTLTVSYRMSVLSCRINSMQITSSSCSFLGLGCPFGSTLGDLTTNSLCLSVCPCHKTIEIHKRLDINTFSVICSQYLPFSDKKGPCRQKDVTANLGKFFYI